MDEAGVGDSFDAVRESFFATVRTVHPLPCLLVLLGLNCGARAQADEDSLLTYDLGEVFVGSAATPSPIGMQRIPLAAWRGSDALNVADAMRLIPGAHVQTNSRGETVLTLRGASDRQVSVFLDGAPLTLPWDQRIDLGLLPSGVVGGGVVAKGNAAARFGANGYGGVVNLISRDLSNDGRLVEADVVGSDPGIGRASAAWLERRGGWSSVVAIQRTESDGIALAENASLPYSQPLDDIRINSDYALSSAFSRISYAPSTTSKVGATLLIVDGEKGVPPEGHVDPAIESIRFWRYPTWQYRALMVAGETGIVDVRIRGTAWGGAFSQTIESYGNAEYERVDRTEEGADVQAGVRLSAEHAFPAATLSGIAGWQIANHDQREYQSTDGDQALSTSQTYRESTWTLGTEADLRVATGLTLTAGAGANLLRTHEAGAAPIPDPLSAFYANVGAQKRLSEGLYVQGSAGRRTRFPSMRERYDDALGRFVVNPDLKPESAWLFDVGVTGSANTMSAEVVLFARRSADTIEIEVLADGQRQRVNLGGSSVYGAEIVGAARLPHALRADGHLTLLRARGFTEDEGDLRLTETPNALGRLALSYQPAQGFTAAIESEYTGTAYSAVSDGLAKLDPSLVVNLRAGYRLLFPRPGLSIEVFGRVNNVSDAVVLPQIGLPAAGRSLLFGLSAALG